MKIKNIKIIIILFMIFWCSNSKISYAQNNTILNAICRKDNDFVTYRDTLSAKVYIPKLVSLKINLLQNDFNKRFNIIDSDNSIPLIFKIKYNDSINLYIVHLYYTAGSSYAILAFIMNLNKVTVIPPIIEGKWMDNNEEGFINKCIK